MTTTDTAHADAAARLLRDSAALAKRVLARRLNELLRDYTEAVEGSDGLAFWSLFDTVDEMTADFALFATEAVASEVGE
jgi:hypothetical protein